MTEEMIRPMTLVDYEDPESHVPVKACSPDNGRTVKVYFTPWGIVWHADDVEVLWNDFLKDKVKSALSIDWNDIQNKPSLVTSSELEARLDNLPAPTVKWSDIQDKPTIPSIDGLAKESELLDYAKLADIPKLPDLSGYAKLTDIPSIAGLVKEAELADYAKKSDIPTTMPWDKVTEKPDIALKQDIPNVSGFAKETELAEYAKKADIPSIDGLAKETELAGVKATADSAKSEAEQVQSTADANSKALQNVYTKEEADRKYWTAEQEQNASNVKSVNKIEPDDQGNVDINLTGFAKINDIPKSMSWENITGKPDLVTNDQLANNMEHALATIDQAKTKIDTSDLHKIKKPSDYSDGFSYEVKTLSDLGIDLTKYDKSVQNGWIGLVKSERVSISNTVYVTQSVRVLGSYRPSTFIRNGSDDTWYPFELLNTWS